MIARIAAGSVIAAALWATVAAAQPAAAPAAWEKMGVQVYESPRPAPAFALRAIGRKWETKNQSSVTR